MLMQIFQWSQSKDYVSLVFDDEHDELVELVIDAIEQQTLDDDEVEVEHEQIFDEHEEMVEVDQ